MRLLRTLGPGLLFAGAAVGVSHLFHATRAGALYGLGLCGVVLLANILKYPPFSFGPRYATATGTSLLEGYRRQGKWALILYALLTVGTMFTVEAAVALFTAVLVKATFGFGASVVWISTGLLGVCALIVAAGKFPWLDKIMKVVVSALTISTVLATALVLGRIDWGSLAILPPPSSLGVKDALVIAALVGWMPSAIDLAVWHSLWTLAKRAQTERAPSLKESMLDFDIGYIGTAILAFCFLFLGAGLMYGTGQPVAASATAFGNQVIGLYTQTLGAWSRPLIAGCAIAVMFSTTLTVVDGFPRAISTLVARFRGPESAGAPPAATGAVYWGSVLALALGSLLVIGFFLKSLKLLLVVATTLSFLTAPILSILNHRAILSSEVPEAMRPGKAMVRFSLTSILVQAVFALAFMVFALPKLLSG